MVLANYGKGLQPLCEALRKGERTRLSMPLFFTSDHVHTPRRERPCVILTGRIRRAERCTTIGVDPVVTKPQTEHTGKQVSAYPPPRKAVFSKERKNIHRIHFKSEPMGRKIYLSPGWTAGFTSCQQLIVSSNSCSLVTQHDLLASVEIEPQPWFFGWLHYWGEHTLIHFNQVGWTSISLSLSCVKV